MKKYKVVCNLVTGVNGKHLTKGNIYNENLFLNLNVHINSGDIVEEFDIVEVEETKEVEPKAKSKK